jgi:hypothetical protein
MINASLTMFIPFTPKKNGKFDIHQLGQISTNILSDLYADYLKNFLGLLLDFLEHAHNFFLNRNMLFNYFWVSDQFTRGRNSADSTFHTHQIVSGCNFEHHAVILLYNKYR